MIIEGITDDIKIDDSIEIDNAEVLGTYSLSADGSLNVSIDADNLVVGGNVQATDKDLLGYVFGRTYAVNTTPTNQKYKIGMDSEGKIQTGSRTYYIPTSLVEVEILASSEKTSE